MTTPPSTPPSSPAAPSGPSPRPAKISPGGFQPDYRYVQQDLRRIARLAVGILVVLVALSFLLR